ncbi:hypothetical protein [Microbacterium sp. SORGH_AS_0862]|uniref:hypothetical protein n=1 Tax=Microbacterium sp. SORGH_AS_0862 TaxID=3041789 RepID=UPI0027D79A3F|nr:hypothetical protein [Microbacterium sp. SORGH_AS_0862]
MGPLLEFLAVWWWTAPAAAGAGTVGYVAATTGRRRARRLALDAARHQEQHAVRELLGARARTRAAQAEVQAARATRSASHSEARRALNQAREAQRTATLLLRAARTRVKAERAQLAARDAELPLARIVREHDTIAARWLEYETDVELAIAVPQMSDPHHPATAAYLQAMQRAQWLRPPNGATRMDPADYVAYAAAVRELNDAFAAAETAALRASAERGRRHPEVPPRESASASDPPRVIRTEPARPAPETRKPAPRTPESSGTAEGVVRTVWPVPRRSGGAGRDPRS